MQESKTGPKARPVIDRLMEKVEWRGNCLVFTGCNNNQGQGKNHGKIGVPGKSPQYVHRIMWEHYNGAIPDGMSVLHVCDNPPCVNIEHLFLGTKAVNNTDMRNKGRHWNQRKTHCPKGHEYNDENTYIKPSDGGRQCLACEKSRVRLVNPSK